MSGYKKNQRVLANTIIPFYLITALDCFKKKKHNIEDISWPRGIRILSSSAESISHSFASRTRERYFQHLKIKFVSPSGHEMFCLLYRY